jgi:hypothetical protein
MASSADGPERSTLALYTTDASGATVQLEAVKQRRYRERFWTMFQTATEQVAAFDRPACYHRALLALLTLADPIQFRRISAREVAELAKLSTNSAERALAMLEADRVVLTNGALTGAKARRLNNRLAWASSADRHGQTPQDPEVIDARGRG